LRASSVSVLSVLGSQVIVTYLIAVVCAVLLWIAALIAYDLQLPQSAALLIAAFVLSTLSFSALGVLLGAVLPTARAAQGVGLLLFFVMMMLSGPAAPPEVIVGPLKRIADIMPLTHVVTLLQDPWLGFGWNGSESLIVAGFMAAAGLVSVWVFRWE
jgi:ABC-2 type transport system permease protein